MLDAFVHDGGSRRSRRRAASDWSCSTGSPRTSSPAGATAERQVNAILGRRHDDVAALRRYLVDEGLLDREAASTGGPAAGRVTWTCARTALLLRRAAGWRRRRRRPRSATPTAAGPAATTRIAAGATSAMAAINEAYRVLRDPARRAVYDPSLRRPGAVTSPTAPRRAPPRHRGAPAVAPLPPARYPWKLVVGMFLLGVAVVLIGAALYEPAAEPPPTTCSVPGRACVIEGNGDAREVNCAGGEASSSSQRWSRSTTVPDRNGRLPRPPGSRAGLRHLGTVSAAVEPSPPPPPPPPSDRRPPLPGRRRPTSRRRRRRTRRRAGGRTARPSESAGMATAALVAGSSDWSCSSSSCRPSSPSCSGSSPPAGPGAPPHPGDGRGRAVAGWILGVVGILAFLPVVIVAIVTGGDGVATTRAMRSPSTSWTPATA